MARIKKEKELDPYAREVAALKAFNRMVPGLRSFARVITNKRIAVMAGPNNMTDGKTIFLRPPMALAENPRHTRNECGVRDSYENLVCPACYVREEINAGLQHEIAHIVHGSFYQHDRWDTEKAIGKLVREHFDVTVEREMFSYLNKGFKSGGLYGLMPVLDKHLGMTWAIVEDLRINRASYIDRPGLEDMHRRRYQLILDDGIKVGADYIERWNERPVDHQMLAAILFAEHGVIIRGNLVDDTLLINTDKVLSRIRKTFPKMKTSLDSAKASIKIIARLRELGYMQLEAQDHKEEDDEPELAEPDEQEDDSEESEDQGDDSGEESEGEGSGDGAESESDGDDSGGESGGDGDSSTGEGAGTDPSSGPAGMGGDSDSVPEQSDGSDEADEESADGTGDGQGSGEAGGAGSGQGGGEGGGQGPGESSGGMGGRSQGSRDQGEESSTERGGENGADEQSDPDRGREEGDGGSDPETGDQADASGGGTAGRDADTEGDDSADGEGPAGSDDAGLPNDTTEADRDRGDDQGLLPDEQDGGVRGDGSPEQDNRGDEEADGGADAGGSDQHSEPEIVDGGGAEPVPSPGSEASGVQPVRPTQEAEQGTGGPAQQASGREDGAGGAGQGGDTEEPSGQLTPKAGGSIDGMRKIVEALLGHSEHDTGHHKDVVVLKPGETAPPQEPTDIGQPEDKEALEGEEVLDPTEASQEDMTDMAKVVQAMWFLDRVPRNIAGIVVNKRNEGPAFNHHAPDTLEKVPESILSKAVLRARVAFGINHRAEHHRNQKSGRIASAALGKRAAIGDPRLFAKKVQPDKRNYAVVIGYDISMSTLGRRSRLINESVQALAEVCNRVGIDFSIYAHSTEEPNGWDWSENSMHVSITTVKDWKDKWNKETKAVMSSIGPVSGNLDGHSMQFYRKQLDAVQATDKILIYFTDGAMPASNYDEELEVLQEEIEVCKKRGYTLLGVGIDTNSPEEHGLETVEVDGAGDIHKVVDKLQKKIAHL